MASVKDVSGGGRVTMWRHPDTGRLHNTGAPAATYVTDSGVVEEWWVNGNLHNEDGPAVTRPGECTQWWVNGKLHRTDGPAVEFVNGDRWWYVNDNLHRTDGPAVEFVDGGSEWWVNGINVCNNKQFQEAAKLSDGEMVMVVLTYGDIQ